MQQGNMLELQDIWEKQDRHGKATYVNEIHMAKMKYVQELFDLDNWMWCNAHGKIANHNNAKQSYHVAHFS